MMDASNIGQAAPDRSTPAVVRPSRFVRVVMGPMTKVLNPGSGCWASGSSCC